MDNVLVHLILDVDSQEKEKSQLQIWLKLTLNNHFDCRLDLDQYYDPLEPRDTGADKMSRLAIISAQKCNLCLGDLARYEKYGLQTGMIHSTMEN